MNPQITFLIFFVLAVLLVVLGYAVGLKHGREQEWLRWMWGGR